MPWIDNFPVPILVILVSWKQQQRIPQIITNFSMYKVQTKAIYFYDSVCFSLL